MPVSVVTAPVVLPLGLQEAKDHLRVDLADDDALIEQLIIAAREMAESFTERALITQTIDYVRDAFPTWGMTLPRAPLQSVTSVKYIDTDGVEQTIDAADYRVDALSTPPRLTPAYNETWPSARDVTNAVTIRLVVGYGDGPADVPVRIKAAMLLMIGDLYEHRQSIQVGVSATQLSLTAERLLWPYRVFRPESDV